LSKQEKKPKTGEKGVAIIMVMTAITLLTYILADFTFEVKLNKIRIFNQKERIQAKLNAESGIKFALTKLKIYQLARNFLEKNKNLKELVPISLLESLVTQPFIFPVPEAKGLDVIQRNALEEFKDSMLVNGGISVEVSLVSGFLNPNNLRAAPKKNDKNRSSQDDQDDPDDGREKLDKDGNPIVGPSKYIEEKMVETLKNAIEAEISKENGFEDLYPNLEPEKLIKELKFYVTSKKLFKDVDLASEFQQLYSKEDIVPKHAPLTSIDELYTLAGWPDDLINLVKDRFSVHDVAIIPLNEITTDQLKILFPKIEKDQLDDFFRHRDGDPETEEEPQPFKNTKEFKQLITGKLGVLSGSEYDKRIKEFEEAGLRLDISGKLFKVVSTGSFERARYKMTAFIDLPVLPDLVDPNAKKDDKNKKKDDKKDDDPDQDDENSDDFQDPDDNNKKNNKKKEEERVIKLLSPRIIEMR
jgi:hypothetical protein